MHFYVSSCPFCLYAFQSISSQIIIPPYEFPKFVDWKGKYL